MTGRIEAAKYRLAVRLLMLEPGETVLVVGPAAKEVALGGMLLAKEQAARMTSRTAKE